MFPEHFPEESFEEFENFDEQHEWPEIGRDQEYYENYIKEIAREKDSLIEEHKILTEEYEGLLEIHNKKYDSEKKKSSPFIPEVEGKDEILDLYNQIELINYKQGLLWERFSEACQCGALDELKSKERYWAERYEREFISISSSLLFITPFPLHKFFYISLCYHSNWGHRGRPIKHASS